MNAAIFGIDLGEEASNAAIKLWDGFVYYVTLQFVDPFWGWLALVVVAIAVITAIEVAVRFYFVDSPLFRKLGGLAIVGMILMLVAYARGEKEARQHDAAARPHDKRRRREPD